MCLAIKSVEETMADKNYYEILGVSKTASADEIKAAYRKLARQYHPDLHPDDPTCAAKLKEINEANETLSDPQKRQQYDYELDHPYSSQGFGSAGGFSGGGFANFGDIFSDIFGFGRSDSGPPRQQRGKDIAYEVELSFLDAALGCTKEITYTRKDKCPSCRGTGAKNGTALKQCPKCNGAGKVSISSGSGLFRTVTFRTCDECKGQGRLITEICTACRGKGTATVNTTVKFEVPSGADNGSYIKRSGFGEVPDNGGEPGDLLMYFKVKPHRIFKRKEFDLYVTVPISFQTACLGGKVMIPSLDKPFEFDIPEGTQSGKEFIIRGKGVPYRSRHGDMHIIITVETPSRLTKEQKEALEKLCRDMDKKSNPHIQTYKDNMGKEFGIDPYIE